LSTFFKSSLSLTYLLSLISHIFKVSPEVAKRSGFVPVYNNYSILTKSGIKSNLVGG